MKCPLPCETAKTNARPTFYLQLYIPTPLLRICHVVTSTVEVLRLYFELEFLRLGDFDKSSSNS
jgi:hypothetical protein